MNEEYENENKNSSGLLNMYLSFDVFLEKNLVIVKHAKFILKIIRLDYENVFGIIVYFAI